MLSWQRDDYNYLINHISETITILYGSDFESKYNVFNIFASNQFKDRVIKINGIESRKETPYLPFLNLFTSSQIKFIKRLGKAFLKDITKSETSAVIYDKITNKQQTCELLDNRVTGILSILNNASKKKPIVLTIGNFEQFDESSIELINLIITGKLKNIFKNLSNIKLYFLCDSDEDCSCLDDVKGISHTEYKLFRPNEENIKEFLLTYFPNFNIQIEGFDRFYHFCGGKLSYCEILAEYFIKNNKIELLDSNDTDLIYSILSNRLYSMGDIGKYISYALELASEIGEEFSLMILGDALNARNNIKSIVKKSKDEFLIKKISDNRYKFYYPIIWSYFITQATTNLKRKDFLFLERAIYLNNAKDYITRGVFFKKAECFQESAEMYILEYFKSYINGVSISQKFKDEVQNVCKEAGLIWMLKHLETYISSMSVNCFQDASDAFNDGIYNSKRLQIIRYLLSGYALYRAATSKQDLDIALNKIHNAEELSRDFEMGLWSDCASLLISFELNINGNLIEAMNWYDKLTNYYELSNSEESKVQLNILKRKSAAVCSVERSFVKTQESADFFKNTYYLSEYVMALNNYAANAMLLGKLDIAYDKISEAKRISEKMPFCVSNLGYIVTNYYTVNVLKDYSNCDNSTRELSQFLQQYEDASWKIIPLINCAIFCALQRKYDEADSYLSEASELNKETNDDYYLYYIQINRASLYYLRGDKQTAITILQEFSDSSKIPKLLKTSEKNYLIKRLFNWINIMKTSNITDPIEFNDFLRNKYVGGNQWDTFSRGFLVSDIQFWSDI